MGEYEGECNDAFIINSYLKLFVTSICHPLQLVFCFIYSDAIPSDCMQKLDCLMSLNKIIITFNPGH